MIFLPFELKIGVLVTLGWGTFALMSFFCTSFLFEGMTLQCFYTSYCVVLCSGEGSQYSGNSDERNLAAMARAIAVHPDTFRVMYFA